MLEVRNVEVVYQRVALVLRGVSLQVGAGRSVALLGPNGAGKTTLLRAITGLLDLHDGRISKGRILWNARDIGDLAPDEVIRGGIAHVMERRRVFADLTVEENLLAGAYSRPSREVAADVAAQYERFPVLAARRRQPAGLCSGGEQQILAVARALMSRPRLLLLDEPTLGLAPKLIETVLETIGSIQAEGIAVLIVEQNAAAALQVADHGYVMESGQVRFDGPASELLADRDVREFYLGIDPGGSRSYREVKHYRRRKRWSA